MRPAFSVLLVLSMLLGAVPAQLAFAVAAADGSTEGDGPASDGDRGVLPSTESFTSTFYNSLDSDNNSKRDAIRARYTVSTTAAQEQVSVLIKAMDGDGNTIKFHYDNFTTFRFGNQERNWTFYSYYSGYYRLSLTLYDSQGRKEDTDTSGVFYLDTGTIRRWITIKTTSQDLDNDSYDDDVEIQITNWTAKAVKDAQVWANGTYLGKTDTTGKIVGKNYPKGWINIDVFWKDLHNSTAWNSEGDGTVASGLSVRAEPFDSDGDELEDDVRITVTNQLTLPVRNAQVTINRTSYGTTDAQGQLIAYNLKGGWWIVNVSKLNSYGSTRFFSEGLGPGTDLDEFFYDWEMDIVDLDNDDRENDLRIRVDVDVDPPALTVVTVWANLTYGQNGTAAYNASLENFTINGTKTKWDTLVMHNITYGIYWVRLVLRDAFNNTEDFAFSRVQLVRPSNHVNVETGVHYRDSNNEMDDALFRMFRVDDTAPNITVTLINETGFQLRKANAGKDGRHWFNNLPDGIFNWTAVDTDGRLIEKGRVVIGARVQVETDLLDLDLDGFFDDFIVTAYNNVDRAVNTVTVTVWAPNGTEVTNNLTIGGQLTALNLTKGTYEFNATYLGSELVNGTFYSYGNVDESFKIVVLPEAADTDGDKRYDDMTVTVVDTDDSPLEFAKVYVDGVQKTLTDLNGTAVVKNLAWGIHTVEARYSGEVAKDVFFSEGTSAHTAKWTMLVINDDEAYVDELEDVGSTDDSLLFYYSEFILARPRSAHLWLVLKDKLQEIDITRLGSSFKAGEMYRIDDTGVIEALLKFIYGSFPADRSAIYSFETGYSGDVPFDFDRRMDGTMKSIGKKADLLVYPFTTRQAEYLYEYTNTATLVVGTWAIYQLPLVAMAKLLRGTTTTTGRTLGELAVDKMVGSGRESTLLIDLTKVGAFATALNALSDALITSYPDEGWAIQDGRNATSYSYADGPDDMAAYIGRFAEELGSGLSTASLRTKATALSDAVDAMTVKAASSTAGVAMIFPNSTDLWEDEDLREFILASNLAEDTRWDEFLEAFWFFRNYTISVHATSYDDDSSGRDNDVKVYVNDSYGKALAGTRVHIDRTYRGTTDSTGYLVAYNFTRGTHLVNVTWGDHEADTTFYSEGTMVPNQAPSATITNPVEDETVNRTYIIEGTASDPDGVVSYVEVRFNGSAWQRATGRANWRYDWNTRDYADGTWLIEARAYDGDLLSLIVKVNVTVSNPVDYADVLVVDDDGGQAYDVFFTAALTAAGEPFDIIHVDPGDDGPDAARLNRAKIVIWFTGEESEDTLTAADVAALTDFLDAGGALWLTGQDIGRDLTSDGDVASAFMRDYLRADYVRDNANDYDLIGIPSEAISEGINITIEGGTGAQDQNYPSEIQPRTGAAVVYLYNGTAEAAVKYGGSTFRTVYFAFGFEGIARREDRNRVMENVLDWLSDTTPTVPNEPPVADAGNDVVTMVGEVVILRGRGTDPDGLIALFDWDVDGDGTYDVSNTTTGVLSWTYDTPGNYTAKLRVTDNIGEFSSDTINVDVRPRPMNQPPLAFAGDDVTRYQGDPIEFQMSGSDPDGFIILYEWDYDGDGTYDEESPTPITTNFTYYDVGVYNAVLRVTDNDGATSTDVRNVTIEELVQNKGPTANAGPDITVQVGTEVTLVGTGKDEDGYIVTYKWDFDGDIVYDFTSGTTGTAIHVYTMVGIYNARLLVIDDDQSSDTDVAVINVTPVHVNELPTANAGTDDIINTVEGEEVEFLGTGTDSDGFIVLYEWDFDNNGVYDWNSTQERATTWVYDTTGLFVARLRVTDNEGAADTDTARVSVLAAVEPNDPPTAEAGGPYQGVAGQQLTLDGSGTDPDGQVASYEWDFDGDGTPDFYSPISGLTTVIYDLAGIYSAILIVTDDDGADAQDVADVIITRANNPPTVTVTTPSTQEVLKGYVVLRGAAQDDRGIVKVEIRIDEGSWTTVTGTTTWTYDFDTASTVEGVHTLRARATDTDGDTSDTKEVQFRVEHVKKDTDESPGFSAATGLVLLAVLGAYMVMVRTRSKRGRREH